MRNCWCGLPAQRDTGMNERGELRDVPEGLRPPAWWMLWANPVFLRYVRARLRASALGVSVLITVIVSAFSFLFMPLVFERVEEGKIRSFRELQQYVARNPRQLTEPVIQAVLQNPPRVQTPEMYQRMALLPLLVIQGVILFVLGTGQVAGGMTAEGGDAPPLPLYTLMHLQHTQAPTPPTPTSTRSRQLPAQPMTQPKPHPLPL